MTEDALPLPKNLLRKRRKKATSARETSPGGEEWTRWQVVAIVNGLAKAEIIRGRLQSEGIPTHIQQDSGGGMLALTVGALGEAKILVPEPLAERALDILGTDV